MRLIAFGGDRRMDGAVEAARRAGWEAMRLPGEGGAPPERADVVLLPWPRSFEEGRLAASAPDGAMEKARVEALMPPCALLVHGAGVGDGDFPKAARRANPGEDEAFLRRNAQLTAEGALAAAMRAGGRALCGSACLVTGFGRIGRALTRRLCAMDAFVIVCARSEAQMRAAHDMGAHPVPMGELSRAAGQADALFNTVPARVFDRQALQSIRRGAILYELASPPYGEDVGEAVRLGVNLRMEGGLPGRYAPAEAGAALFDAARRALQNEGGMDDG